MAVGGGSLLNSSHVSAQSSPDEKFLIVLAATGGASIIDSVMPIRESEAGAAASTLNCFPDSQVVDIAGSTLRAVDSNHANIGVFPGPGAINLSSLVDKLKDDMLVATLEGTSVNHVIAQERSLTGNGAWNGRTLAECVASAYGSQSALPNMNMAAQGFQHVGIDKGLPYWAFHETVDDPRVFSFATHGARGIRPADINSLPIDGPSSALLDRARALRDDRLEDASVFRRTFAFSQRLERWSQHRAAARQLEAADLIAKLTLLPDSQAFPLSEFNMGESPELDDLLVKFPSIFADPLDAQAALAFLLLKHRVSTAVTISPTFNIGLGGPFGLYNPPLAFDYSHNAHRATQAFLWMRILQTADGLRDLLKSVEYAPGSGESMWDHTLIYVATDFGRDKIRPSGATEFSTGHNLNNGVMILSPLVNPGVLGGVDPNTGLTYGFDPTSGAPDTGRTMTEPEIFAGILQALQVDTSGSGLPDMPAMRKT